MRVMNLRFSNKKKVRGAKRKCENMIKNINEVTELYPEIDLEYGYWHTHLPVAQAFIDSTKTPSYVRKICMQTLIDRVNHLIKLRPKTAEFSRVVTSIDLPRLWDSQITVFFDEEYFSNFFTRNNDYQRWTELPDSRNIIKEYNLDLPEGLMVRGYLEEITDEDYNAIDEIWFIGELN